MPIDVGEFEGAMRGPGTGCWYKLFAFSDEQRGKLDEVLWHRQDITSAAISRVLTGWGFTISGQSVRRHRQRDCDCGKRS